MVRSAVVPEEDINGSVFCSSSSNVSGNPFLSIDFSCDRIKYVNAKIKTQCALQSVLEPVGSPAVSLF